MLRFRSVGFGNFQIARPRRYLAGRFLAIAYPLPPFAALLIECGFSTDARTRMDALIVASLPGCRATVQGTYAMLATVIIFLE